MPWRSSGRPWSARSSGRSSVLASPRRRSLAPTTPCGISHPTSSAPRPPTTAKEADRYNARPWLGDAYLQFADLAIAGSKPGDLRWKTIPILLLKAASGDRNPDAWTLHSERAKITRDLLKQVGQSLSPREIIPLAGQHRRGHAHGLAHLPDERQPARTPGRSERRGFHVQDAAAEAQEALRLDELNPHPDKKLAPAIASG